MTAIAPAEITPARLAALPYDLDDRYRPVRTADAADRCAGDRAAAGRAARALDRAARSADGDVRLRLPGQPAGRASTSCWPACRTSWTSTTSPSSPASTRSSRRPRCGAARSSCRSGTARTTASSVSGTARARASTAPPTPSGTPTCTASTRAAACCSSSATTRPPSPRPCPPSASGRWPRSASRSCSRATPREIVTLGLHGIAMSRASGCVVALKIVADVADGAWVGRRRGVADVDIAGPRRSSGTASPFTYRQRPMACARPTSSRAEADLLRSPRRASCARTPPPTTSTSSRSTRRTRRSASSPRARTFDSMRQALTDLGVDDDALAPGRHPAAALGMIEPGGPDTVSRVRRGTRARSSSSRTRPRSSRPRSATSSTARPTRRGSSARRTPTAGR